MGILYLVPPPASDVQVPTVSDITDNDGSAASTAFVQAVVSNALTGVSVNYATFADVINGTVTNKVISPKIQSDTAPLALPEVLGVVGIPPAVSIKARADAGVTGYRRVYSNGLWGALEFDTVKLPAGDVIVASCDDQGGFTNSITDITITNGSSLTAFTARLPEGLQTLDCCTCQLSSLPKLPNSLLYLYCYGNQLTALPTIPNRLIDVDCSYNQLTVLPYLPPSVTTCYCGSNLLTSINNIPLDYLTTLDCSFNQLTAAWRPMTSANLTYIDCSYNQLTILPDIPNKLEILFCSNNQLSALPILPCTLRQLDCHFNPITTQAYNSILDQLIANTVTGGVIFVSNDVNWQAADQAKKDALTDINTKAWTIIF